MDRIQEIDEGIQKYSVLEDTLTQIRIKLFEERKAIMTTRLQDVLNNLNPESYMAFRHWGQIEHSMWEKMTRWMNETYVPKGLRHSGTWPHTNQAALELLFDQNKPFEEQLGLVEFWPYVEAFRDDRYPTDEPQCYVNISEHTEHTLSQYCSYSLRSNSEKNQNLGSNPSSLA